MTTRFAAASFTSLGALRIVAALTVTTGSFVAMRQVYHGLCVWDEGLPLAGHEWSYTMLTLAFSLGFIWLIAEMGRPAVVLVVTSKLLGWIAAVLTGLVIYLAIAGVVWGMHPRQTYGESGWVERAWFSGFWANGLLVETGNFTPEPCGY